MVADCPEYNIEYHIPFVEESNSRSQRSDFIDKRNPFINNWAQSEYESNNIHIPSQKILEHIEYYNYNDKLVLEIPRDLSFLINSFKQSEYILELEEDWDDEGAEKYNFATWEKAIIFMSTYAKSVNSILKKKIQQPKIYHGPRKSIDILLENDNYTLLINILDKENRGIYFGKDAIGNTCKGEINLSSKNYSLLPLAFQF